LAHFGMPSREACHCGDNHIFYQEYLERPELFGVPECLGLMAIKCHQSCL